MRIQGQHQQFIDALRREGLNGARDTGIAVGHRQFETNTVLERRAQQRADFRGEPLRIHGQRRTLMHPYLAIVARRAQRPKRQNHAVQKRQPNQARGFDDAAVAQEFAQISLDGEIGGRIRRS